MRTLYKLMKEMMKVVMSGASTGQTLPDVSVASGATWKEAGRFTLPPGVWMVTISVSFAMNATGYRLATLHTESAAAGYGIRILRQPAANGSQTAMVLTMPVVATEETTYYINVQHNAGSALTVSPRYTAVRLGSDVNQL